MKTIQILLFLLFSLAANAQLTFTTNNNAITITGYKGSLTGVLTLPATTNGYSLKSIGYGAFQNQQSLTSIGIPNTVTNIGGVAFQGCFSLTNVTIPSSVITIGDSAFCNCRQLPAITVDPANPSYSSTNGVLFNKLQTTLLQCPGAVSGSYTVPGSVTNIGFEALYACTHVTSLNISSNVSYVGDEVVQYCLNLTAINVDTNNSSYCSVDGVLFDKPKTLLKAFPCGLGGSYLIPDGVTNIDFSAFAYSSLTNVTIPASVTFANDYAFTFSALESVVFLGDAPGWVPDTLPFDYDNATVYYLPETAGWDATFEGLPTVMLFSPDPVIVDHGSGFGVQTNGFNFVIDWATNASVVVEAATNLVNPSWLPLQTNILTGVPFGFGDSQWSNSSSRFYRVRSQ